MDNRISGEVAKVREQMLDLEYRVMEGIQKSLGGTGCRLVDVGCSSRGLLGRSGDRLADLQPHSVGIDLDIEALAKNQNVTYRICASCYALPLKANSVDVIVCRWVFEHLDRPELAMSEFARVLRKGGFVYIKTPNLWNYSMMVSWATPVGLHNVIRSVSLGRRDKNIPTFYRANTNCALTRLATNSGFAVHLVELCSYSYMYYIFNKELFLTMRGISRLVGKITNRAQQTLLCVLEKIA